MLPGRVIVRAGRPDPEPNVQGIPRERCAVSPLQEILMRERRAPLLGGSRVPATMEGRARGALLLERRLRFAQAMGWTIAVWRMWTLTVEALRHVRMRQAIANRVVQAMAGQNRGVAAFVRIARTRTAFGQRRA